MKHPRILMVPRLFYPWVGGAERQAHKLAKQLKEKDVEVKIVTGWWFRGTPQRDSIDGIPIFRNHTMWEMFGIPGLRKFGGYLYILTLWLYLWRYRADYDIIHLHGLNYHTFAAVFAGRLLKRKTLTKAANSGEDSDLKRFTPEGGLPLSQYMLPTALKCDCFVAINEKIGQELNDVGVPWERIIRLTNGVETDQVTPKTNYALNEPATLTYLGRLHHLKGADVLLKAIHRLLQQHPSLNLCVQLVGDGPYRDELQQMAGEFDIRQQVIFVGQTDKVSEYLLKTDIFVLPSHAEGISNALLEAMTFGLPAVVSEIPGNVDVIQHNQNGLYFEVNNPDSLAEALATLLHDADLRERLGKAAFQTIQDHFSMNYVADRYIEIYQNLLSSDH